MGKQADIIAAYVTKVGDLQHARQEALSDEELKSIALELGLRPEDIARADKAADEHLRRAANYQQHDLLDDALGELRAAVVLRPLDHDVLLALARCHAARWRARGDDDDRDEADRIARKLIEIAPDDARAFALRRDLQAPATKTPSTTAPTVGATALGIGLTAVLGGIGMIFMMLVTRCDAPPEPMTAEVTAPAPAPVPVPAPTPAITTGTREVSVSSVPLVALPGAELSGARTELSLYDDSWSFRVSGRLRNGSAAVITELTGEVQLLDPDGGVVATKAFDVQEGYQPALRPGEVRGFDALMYADSYPPGFVAPVEARLRITSQAHETAAASYPPDAPVALSWGSAGPPPGVSVSAARRVSSYTTSFSDKLHHRAAYTFTVDEGSASVQLLKVQLQHLDADGNRIEEDDDTYVVSTSEPPLEPGEARVIAFLSYVPEQPASERLVVLEAR